MKIVSDINNNGRPINLLFDASSIFYRSIYGIVKELEKEAYQNFGMFKSCVLENIVHTSRMFDNPKIILCFDKKQDGKYWRNEIFPAYKEQRKTMASRIPKEIIAKQFVELMLEIKSNFPWHVYMVEKCEADDIIAVYVQEHASDNNIIVGTDKDYIMLTSNPNVKILNHGKKIFEDEDAVKFKFAHIVSGDSVDNIRNIFSTANKDGTRQKPITKKMLTEMFDVFHKEGEEKFKEKYLTTPQLLQRYQENCNLIDLNNVPQEIRQKIIDFVANEVPEGNYAKARKYFINNRLRTLMDMTVNGL